MNSKYQTDNKVIEKLSQVEKTVLSRMEDLLSVEELTDCLAVLELCMAGAMTDRQYFDYVSTLVPLGIPQEIEGEVREERRRVRRSARRCVNTITPREVADFEDSNPFAALEVDDLPDIAETDDECRCMRCVNCLLKRDPGEVTTWMSREDDGYWYLCGRARWLRQAAERRRRMQEEAVFKEAEIFNEGMRRARAYDVCLNFNRDAAVQYWVEPDPHFEEVRRTRRFRSKCSMGPLFRRQARLRRQAKAFEEKIEAILGGKAQALFSVDVDHNFATEHVLRIPVVEEMVSKLQKTRSDLSWTEIVTELVFFALHLVEGGLTIHNLMLCAAHLLYRIGKPAMISVFKRLVGRVHLQSVSALRVVGMAISGVVSLLTVLLFSRLPRDANLDQFINRFSRLGACMKSAEQIHTVAGYAVNGFVNLVKTEVFGMASDELEEFSEIDKFCDEVMAENTTDISARCTADTGAFRQKVNRWLMQADAIRGRLDALRVPHVRTSRFQSVSLFLFKLRDMLDATAPGLSRARIAPLLIHIHGTTGVGKSSCLDYLNTRLLVALGSNDPKDLHNKVYYRMPGTEFFDGFINGTEIVVCDDFGSVADSQVRPSPEPIEAIRMGNTAPYKPPKADLSGKATAQFEAKVVIWTSNRVDFKFPSLTNPEAVANRVHLRFKQRVHPDFAVIKNIGGQNLETLDNAKVAEAAKTNPNAWRDCMLFDMEDVEGVPLIDRQSYRCIQEGMTFEEFATVCVDALKRKQQIGGGMRSEREDYYAACVRAAAESGRPRVMEGNPFPEDLIEMNTVEFATLQDNGRVGAEIQPVWFEEPGLIGRCLGKHAHLNVFRFIANHGLHGQWQPYTEADNMNQAQLEELNNFMRQRCFSMPASQMARAAQLIYRTWRAIFNHEPDPMIHFAEFKNLTTFSFLCQVHDDPEAVETVTQWCRRCVVESGKTGLMQAFRKTVQFSQRHPVVAMILNIITNVIVLYGLKKMFEWLFGLIWKAGAAVVGGVSSLLGWTPVQIEQEAYSTGVAKSVKTIVTEHSPDGSKKVTVREEAYPNATTRAVKTVKTEVSGEAESLTDQNAAEIRRKIALNMYHILTRSSSDGPWYGIGSLTIVKGRLAITNRHLVHAMREDIMLRSTTAGLKEFVMKKSDLNIVQADDADELYGKRDVCAIELPQNVNIHGNLIPFFMKAEDFSRHTEPARACLVKYTAMSGPSILMFQETDKIRAFDRSDFRLELDDTSTVRVRLFYCYAMETQGGDCGGVVVAFDPRFNRKVVGIHMAGGALGNGYTAAAAAVSQEFIKHLTDKMQWRHKSSFFDGDVPVDNPADAIIKEDGTIGFDRPLDGLVLYGKAHSRVHSAKVSTISASPVHNICGPVLKRPAYLVKCQNAQGVEVDPLQLAMLKVRTPSYLVDRTALRVAAKHVADMINGIDHEKDARTLTFDEAVQGIAGDERYPAINRSTSPGYGWAKKGKGKTFYLGTDKFVVRPEVRELYESTLAGLRSGKRAGLYWTDTLKDELRPIEKVEAGKTRLFSAGEMVLTILLRQFFMGFNAHMARNAIVVESCVGVNPYSQDWTAIAVKLQRYGRNVVAGDFTNYDGTLPADGLWAVLDVINEFYGDSEDNNVRALLWVEIVNSVHIQGDTVYGWTHSQPSGCPFTSVLNSVFHSMLVRIAYLLSARRYCPEKATLANFNRLVSHVNYGDDDVTNVSVEADWFNQITMAEAYATFGMTYTDESKSGELVKYKTLEEIQFLKRSFVWDHSQARYRAPLDINTIREMPCWNKTKGDQYTLTADVLEDAVYELAQHSREVFDKEILQFEVARKIVAARVPNFSLATYDEIDFVDAHRYTLDGVISRKALKLSDRGTTILAENCRAANPASVSHHPLLGYGVAEGGVFTPTDECVPSLKNRLLVLPTQPAIESLPRWLKRLAQSKAQQLFEGLTMTEREDFNEFFVAHPNRPTMCNSSYCFQPPEVTKFYRHKKNCIPCDFHGGMDFVIQEEVFREWKAERRGQDTVDVGGPAQSGSEEELSSLTTYTGEAKKLEFLWEALGQMQAANARLLTRTNLAVQSISYPKPEFALEWLRDEKVRIKELRKELNLWMQANQLGGKAQAGDEPSGVDSNPNFAGGAAHEDTHEVMTFHQDGDVENMERSLAAPVPEPIRAGAEDKLANDLKDFLRRPIHLHDFVWALTASRGAELLLMDFPREFLEQTMVREKLAGFRFVRCTLCVEIQINAQPMNAGGLIAWFEPLRQQLNFRPSSVGHMGGIFGYPNVIYRLGDSTAVQLRIPFFPLISHYDLTTSYGGSGGLHLTVLSALTGSDDVDGTVFVWADDIETSMPTGMPLSFGRMYAAAPRPALPFIPEEKEDEYDCYTEMAKTVKAEKVLSGRAQAGGPAAERKRPGNIETLAGTLGGVASVLSNVPVIGSFASVAQTVLSGVGSVASAFGWSKPVDPEFPTEVGQIYGRNMTNYNGDSKVKVLALDARNSVNIPTAVFNTEEDEMAFSTLLRRPIYTDAFKMLGTQAQGTLLYSWPVEPAACKKAQMTVGTLPTYWIARFENYLSYCSSLAKYYRGGITYTFKFFKTDFHSGRVRFTYVPGARRTTNFSSIDVNKCYSEVHDLRSTRDVEFTIPYNYLQPWKDAPDTAQGASLEEALAPIGYDPQGYIYVSVVNALRNPSTVASEIEAIMLVSAASDFQFGVPSADGAIKIISRATEVPTPTISGRAQAGNFFETTTVEEDVNANSIGEIFTGFRQWLKRYHIFQRDEFQDLTKPYVVNAGPPPGLVSDAVTKNDAFRRAEVLYRFQAGPMRMMIATAEPRSYIASVYAGARFDDPAPGTSEATTFTTVQEPLMEFEIPFYQPFPALLTDVGAPRSSQPSDTIPGGFTSMPYNTGTRFILDPVPPSTDHVYRAIGESFSYGFLIGVPVTMRDSGFPRAH